MRTLSIRRGDIWIIDFDPTTGREQRGSRPSVVLSSDLIDSSALGLTFVVPGTRTARYDASGRPVPNHIRVEPLPSNGLSATTFFMTEQLRSVSIERLVKRIGVLTDKQLFDLEEIAILLLDLGPK
ncbi:MAG: type II toxin-antitoxin system PemK/MazF family toxin [Candidatus Obscuribacterales bacterium]